MLFKNILLKDIDFSSNFFRFLPVQTGRQKSLYKEIRKNGILYPPVLIENKDKYILVSGFKRTLGALKSGKKSVDALVMDYSPDSFLKGFYLRAADKDNENFDETLKFYAESRLYSILLRIKDIFPQINFQSFIDENLGKNKKYIEKVSQFLKTPFFIQKAFFEGKIALPVLFEVLKYNAQDTKNIIAFFGELSPGLNRQREIISLVEELAHKEDKSISEVLGDSSLIQIINDDKSPKPQKLSFIISLLNQKRYPEMSRLRKSFELLAKESGFSDNPKIISPKNFEDSDFRLELKFNNVETYFKLCKKINKSLEEGDIERFFNLV